MSCRTALYRLHDAEGVLLYVGITSDPERRFAQHSSGKAWWPEVARKSVEWYPSRSAAEAAEEAAIKAKWPRYNIQHCECPPEVVTVVLPQADVRGLDILFRQFAARVREAGGPADQFTRADLLTDLLQRELAARGLYGDPPCWHAGSVRWPDGVIVEAGACGCGSPVLPDGSLPPGAPCPGCHEVSPALVDAQGGSR